MNSALDPATLTSFTLPVWTAEDYANLLALLEALADPTYAEFTTKGTRSQYPIVGVRLPLLRQIARAISHGHYQSFLEICDTRYFETVMLRSFVVARLRNLSELEEYFWSQVDLIDDWSLCDSFCNSLKLAQKYPETFLKIVDTLISTGAEFKVRIGLVILLSHFVRAPYLDTIFNYLDQIQSDVYYINMAEAWLLCEVIIKFPKEGQAYLRRHHLNEFTLRKTISKVRDSYRVSNELKDDLKTTFLSNQIR